MAYVNTHTSQSISPPAMQCTAVQKKQFQKTLIIVITQK